MWKSCCKLVLFPSCDLYLISIQFIMHFCLVVMVTHRFCNLRDLDYFYGFAKNLHVCKERLCSWLHTYVFRKELLGFSAQATCAELPPPLGWPPLVLSSCSVVTDLQKINGHAGGNPGFVVGHTSSFKAGIQLCFA